MQANNRTLLFIEPDEEYAKQLQEHFALRNTVIIAHNLNTAEDCLRLLHFDAIVMELTFPDGNGLELFQRFHALPPTLIHAKSPSENLLLECFQHGAIDYVAKPCSVTLLDAYLHLRLSPVRRNEKRYGNLRVNPVSRTVFYKETQIPLTSSEFNILLYLSQHAGKYYSANDLYEEIWQAQSLNTTTIRKHISTLRKKMLALTNGKDFILTDFGKGYAFTTDYEE